jgi:hypothetical protein
MAPIDPNDANRTGIEKEKDEDEYPVVGSPCRI